MTMIVALHYIVMVMRKSTESKMMIIKNNNDNNNRVTVFRFLQGPARVPLGSRVPVFRYALWNMSYYFWMITWMKNVSNFQVKVQAQSVAWHQLDFLPTQLFFCKYCEIFKNSFFQRTPLVADCSYLDLRRSYLLFRNH